MSKSRAIIGNTAIQFLGRGLLAAMSIVVIKLLTNYLGVDGYGNYGAIYEYLAIFGVFADFGLFTIGVREMSEDDSRAHIEKVYGNLLSLRIILVITAMTAATVLAYLVPSYQDTPIPLGVALAGIFVILSLTQGGASSILQYHLKMQWVTLGFILGKLVTLACIAAVVFFVFPNDSQQGFYYLILAGSVGAVLNLGITLWAAQKYVSLRPRINLEYWRHLLKRAAPYGFAVALSTVYFKFDVTLVRILRDETEAGVYLVPMRIMEVLTVIPLYFMNSVLPTMTKMFKASQKEINRIMQYSFDFLSMLGIPILIGGFILAWPLISMVASEEFLSNPATGFVGSDVAMKYLIVAMVLAYFTGWLTFSLVAIEQQMKLLWINAGTVIFNIITNLIFIPIYGFQGAAMTSIASEFLVLVMAYLVLRKYKTFQLSLGNFAITLFAGFVMGMFIWRRHDFFAQFGNIGIIALIAVSGLIYGFILWWLGALNRDTFRLAVKQE